MKKTLLIAFLFGATSFAFSQNPSQTDEVAGLKKQVSSLKQSNTKLEQTIKELKTSAKEMQDNIDAQLKGFDQKLNTLSDSLKTKELALAKTENRMNQVFHSLNLRKTAFYIIFIIAIILLIASYMLLMKKLKTITEKNEVKLFNLKDALEVDANKTKSDFLSQISLVKAEITATKDDLEKKIKDVKK